MVRLLVPVPLPDPGYFNKAIPIPEYFPRAYPTYQSVGYGWEIRSKLTKESGTGMDAAPNLPKGRLRVWMLYLAYQGVGYGYTCRTKLTKRSGTVMDVLSSLPKGRVWYGCLNPYPYPTPGILTRPYPVPRYSPAGYRTYSSVGYGWGNRTNFTKVSGTGTDAVPNLPKGRVRLWMFYQAYQKVGYGTAA